MSIYFNYQGDQWFLLPTILLDPKHGECGCGCGEAKSTVSIIFLCMELGLIF